MSLGAFSITAAQAYTLAEAALPAETPPSSFSDDIYVDSRGCVYVRASIGTTVNWVPRLSRDRETVVCNMTPSMGEANVAAAVAAIPAATSPAPVAPAPTSLPTVTTAAVAAPAPAPASIQPAPVAPVAPVAVAARGTEPVPAEPAAVVSPAGAAEVARSMDVTCPSDGAVVRVQLGGDTVAVSCPRGMTRATSYVVTHADGSRSRLVAHPAAAAARGSDTVVIGASPVTPVVSGSPAGTKVATSGPVTAAAPIRVPEGYQPAWDDDRLNPDRGPRTATGDAQMARVFDTSKVPMPAAEETPAVRAAVGTRQTGAAAPALWVAPGARWVQVGAFGVSSNAKRAIGTLQGLGYTAATSRTRSGLTLVLAGPFASTAELKRALQTLRGIYPDAYTRS